MEGLLISIFLSKTPAGLFASLVLKKRYAYVTLEDEELAFRFTPECHRSGGHSS